MDEHANCKKGDNVIDIEKSKGSNVKIYEFGVRVDRDSLPDIGEQIVKARRLYNNLIAAIQLILSEQQAYILAKAGDEAIELNSEIDSLTEQFLAARANQDDAAMKAAATERHQKRVLLWGMLANARKALKKELQEKFLSRIGMRTDCDTYKLRCAAVTDGLGWATANAMLDNALDAFKKTISKGQSPRFAKASEKTHDTLTLQFTEAGGVPVEKIFSKSTGDLVMAFPKSGKYGEFSFRLGAAKAGKAVTGTWKNSREIPPNATIGVARLIRRRIGKDFKYWLQLQIKTAESPTEIYPQATTKKPLVAIHFGWAKDGDKRNIAGIADCGDPSVAEILCLPETIEKLLNQSENAQAKRDASLNELVPKLKSWELAGIPEELMEEVVALKKLRPEFFSQTRLHRVVGRLMRSGYALPDWLDEWRKQDKMDWQEEAHVARRARNQRKNFYRETAKRMAIQYHAIILSKPDLKDAAELIDEKTGERTELVKKARAGRVVAALYELDTAIRQTFEREGGAIMSMNGEEVASHCSICGGAVESVKDVPDTVACKSCGSILNKKQNGAANCFQLASEVAEEKIVEYHIAARQADEDRAAKQKGKLELMKAKRNEIRNQAREHEAA